MPTRDLGAMSLDDLYNYAKELRKDFSSLSAGIRSDEDMETSRRICAEVNALDNAITLCELEDRRANARIASNFGGFRSTSGGAILSIGERVVSDENIMRWASEQASVPRGAGPQAGPVIDMTGVGTMGQILTRGQMDIFSGPNSGTRAVNEWAGGGPPTADASGSANLLPVGQPIPPVPRQAKLYLRDLLPSMTTTLAQVPYVQEVTPTSFELGASAVAEGGTKPNATLDFVGAKADPTVLATTLVISKQLFEDAAAVVQYINQRLPYLVKFKEDWEFLNGSGTWPDMQGIYNQTGLLTQTTVSSDNAQTLGAAFAQIEQHDGAPTFVVLNPTNAWNMFTKRAASGSGTFDAGTPFSALPLTVWGVPTYRTRAAALNTACVADGERGAMIIDRESVNIQTYRERYAELNQVLLVCEERCGLAVWRPDLFCQTSLV